MMHASLDSIEEAMQKQGKGRSSSDTKWIGLLCPMEESYIYGEPHFLVLIYVPALCYGVSNTTS